MAVVLDQGLAEKTQETKEKGIMQTKSWCGFKQTIPGSHVESRFNRKETREKKGVLQTGRIYTETELWACKETAWRRRKENGSSKKMDRELERDKNRKVSGQGVDTRDK